MFDYGVTIICKGSSKFCVEEYISTSTPHKEMVKCTANQEAILAILEFILYSKLLSAQQYTMYIHSVHSASSPAKALRTC